MLLNRLYISICFLFFFYERKYYIRYIILV
nr:MAG TPA: hypothetical protein [Caudoviricetes sp.]